MRSKWPWVAWKSGTEADKAKEESQANSVDRFLQKRLTEFFLEPDRCNEVQLAAVKLIADFTLNDFKL